MYRVKLIILCGIPGCGKTTYAKGICKDASNVIYISSDTIRQELYGDENIQGEPSEVFAVMQERTIGWLNNGVSVVYDATNLTRKDRAGIISVCPKFVKIECHIIWAEIEECIKRDDNRNRHVGRHIINKMVQRFQMPYYDEGIDEIKIIRDTYEFDDYQYYNRIVDAMKIPHDNPNHTLPIDEHCNAAGVYATQHHFQWSIVKAAFMHDCGKPYVKCFKNTQGEETDIAHYYNHQCVSAWIACGFEDDLETLWLISTHMAPFSNEKYYLRLPIYLKRMVDRLHEADLNAK